jgi:hypothetical protein
MQRPDEAERLAAGVLKSDRGNSVAAQVLGRALMVQNRPAEAIAVLERAARRSNDPAIETLLAGALAAAGRRDWSNCARPRRGDRHFHLRFSNMAASSPNSGILTKPSLSWKAASHWRLKWLTCTWSLATFN